MTAKKKIVSISAVVVLLILAAAAWVFKPWLLFVDVEVNDEIPMAVASAAPAAPAASAEAPTSTTPTGPIVVGSGEFISHEHDTTGTATILRLEDGSHQLALQDLATSNGPDVHVWLSAAPVIPGREGWFTAKDYDHVDLGAIKGNRGNQVYQIPAEVDVKKWQSVVLWCEDFSVSFGAAAL